MTAKRNYLVCTEILKLFYTISSVGFSYGFCPGVFIRFSFFCPIYRQKLRLRNLFHASNVRCFVKTINLNAKTSIHCFKFSKFRTFFCNSMPESVDCLFDAMTTMTWLHIKYLPKFLKRWNCLFSKQGGIFRTRSFKWLWN